ncbi:Protein of unknown function [Pyronema omphalodes CBS 100304]|uniref:Uncharacterized protein n=1 Tax=Pyronema omphalodes (strain CBS 100304) TaxID=1076935 RepID=U4LN86_PYROM|nr:Protein of unknown function [Pyronema omphalodes CBS 100304]
MRILQTSLLPRNDSCGSIPVYEGKGVEPNGFDTWFPPTRGWWENSKEQALLQKAKSYKCWKYDVKAGNCIKW